MNSQQIIKQHLANLDTIESSGKSIYIGRRLVKRCMKYIETSKVSILTPAYVMLLLTYATIAGSLTSNGRRTYALMALILGTQSKWPDSDLGYRGTVSTPMIVSIITVTTQSVKLIYKRLLEQPTTVKFGQFYPSTSTYKASRVTMDTGTFYAPYIPIAGVTVITTTNKLKS